MRCPRLSRRRPRPPPDPAERLVRKRGTSLTVNAITEDHLDCGRTSVLARRDRHLTVARRGRPGPDPAIQKQTSRQVGPNARDAPHAMSAPKGSADIVAAPRIAPRQTRMRFTGARVRFRVIKHEECLGDHVISAGRESLNRCVSCTVAPCMERSARISPTPEQNL